MSVEMHEVARWTTGGRSRSTRSSWRTRCRGTSATPIPRMAELRRESPVHVGPIDLGDGADDVDPTKPQPVTVFGFDEVGPGPARQRDLLVHGVRRDHGRGDGPDHPPDGRARAPAAPGPGVADLPVQGARAVGGGPGRAGGRRAHRRIRRPRDRRPGPGVDLQLPGPGHRPILGLPRADFPDLPAMGHRDHQRRHQLGARHGGIGGACATTSPGCWPTVAASRPTT